jgi:hypothetical protein
MEYSVEIILEPLPEKWLDYSLYIFKIKSPLSFIEALYIPAVLNSKDMFPLLSKATTPPVPPSFVNLF